MKRSMIAVCLLLLSPSRVIACYEDHNAGAGWFDQQTVRWSNNGNSAQTRLRDTVMDVSLFAGGLGFVILLGVLVRAMIQASGQGPVSRLEPEERVPLALPFDGPPCEPCCVRLDFKFDENDWSSSGVQEDGAVSATRAASPVDSFCCVN
jgi:hypothetical protein